MSSLGLSKVGRHALVVQESLYLLNSPTTFENRWLSLPPSSVEQETVWVWAGGWHYNPRCQKPVGVAKTLKASWLDVAETSDPVCATCLPVHPGAAWVLYRKGLQPVFYAIDRLLEDGSYPSEGAYEHWEQTVAAVLGSDVGFRRGLEMLVLLAGVGSGVNWSPWEPARVERSLGEALNKVATLFSYRHTQDLVETAASWIVALRDPYSVPDAPAAQQLRLGLVDVLRSSNFVFDPNTRWLVDPGLLVEQVRTTLGGSDRVVAKPFLAQVVGLLSALRETVLAERDSWERTDLRLLPPTRGFSLACVWGYNTKGVFQQSQSPQKTWFLSVPPLIVDAVS
ncbi:MAG: hypothetical protein WC184_12565 [Acidimicrobiia bacterium]